MERSAGEPTEEAVRSQLERILQASRFARARRQQRFLRFTVEAALEHRAATLKESTLGVEVFDRGTDFDPAVDNIVRVEAHRLRCRLEAYYRSEGQNDGVLIEFPVGSYAPRFVALAAPESIPTDGRGDRRRRRRLWIAGATALAMGLLMAGIWAYSRAPATVAVLAFSDFGGAEPYRAEGVADSITQALAESGGLRVVARTSAFQFRNAAIDVREIGKRLGATVLVEGSLRGAGDRLRISARLVNAKNGFEIWSGTEEADAADLLTAERAIAAGIARALHLDLRGAAGLHSPPADARDLVLRARYLVGRGGAGNREQAVANYERALSIDPEFAQAWGELAQLWSLTAFHDSRAALTLTPRIKAAGQRALLLDAGVASAHLALARIAWSREWDWPAAERSFRQALERDPNYAAARQAYALALASRGRYAEALSHSRRAAELDPLAYGASNDLGVVLYGSRDYQAALAHARRALSLAPESLVPRFLLGVTNTALGRYDQAVSELERCAGRGRPVEVLGRLGFAYARAGRSSDASAIRAELERDSPAGDSIYRAMVEAGRGDADAAIGLLESSAARRETDFLFSCVDPVFDSLHRDGRFRALCGRLGLSIR